jgi:hypothetical protein
MKRTLVVALLGIVCVSAEARAEESVGGVRVYTKSQTPRHVQTHSAYPLRQGGDTWLFTSASRRAQHGDFVTYCRQSLPGYAGQRIDCADVALDNLLNYAKDRGLRLTFKVWKNGWRYADSAQFQSFAQMKSWAKQYLGAHNITDNCKLIKPLAALTTPESWSENVKPGDLLMWSYNKPSRSHPGKPGLPTAVGHTQPIMDVQAGATLSNTRLQLMNGDIQLSTGEPLPAHTSTSYVEYLKPVSAGVSLSNYPQYSGQLFKVLQKYDWNQPRGPQENAQPSQGPLRWGIFN